MTAELEQLAEEAARALYPVLVDVLSGAREPQVLQDATAGFLFIIGQHLGTANGAVLLADLQAVERCAEAILEWLAAHPPPDTGNARDDAALP